MRAGSVVATRMDVTALHGALDRARKSKDLTWREVSRRIGVNASTLSRMGQGKNPDVNAFARMVCWLNLPAEAFFVEAGQPVNPLGEVEPELVAQLAPLLRARKDLGERDVQLLEDLIISTVRWFRAGRSATGVDPDYEIVAVSDLPAVPATPVTVTDAGGHVWAPGARGVVGDLAEYEQRCTRCRVGRLGLLARGEEFASIRWHYPPGFSVNCPGDRV